MTRRLTVLLAALATLIVLVSPTTAGAGDGLGTVRAHDSLEVQVLGGLNRIRAQHGLPALRLSKPLGVAAEAHSRDMARRGYFDHDGPGGWTFARRMARFYPQGDHRLWAAGENLLWYSPDMDAETALAMWMKSPGHRQNILRREWREIGLSAIHADLPPASTETSRSRSSPPGSASAAERTARRARADVQSDAGRAREGPLEPGGGRATLQERACSSVEERRPSKPLVGGSNPPRRMPALLARGGRRDLRRCSSRARFARRRRGRRGELALLAPVTQVVDESTWIAPATGIAASAPRTPAIWAPISTETAPRAARAAPCGRR